LLSSRHPSSSLFPYTTLFRSRLSDALPDPVPEETWKTFQASAQLFVSQLLLLPAGRATLVEMLYELPNYLNWQSAFLNAYRAQLDRKSTRLNSSHGSISYAVF